MSEKENWSLLKNISKNVRFVFQNLQTTLPTVRMIVDVSKSAVVLSSQQVIKLLKSKEASNVVDIKVKAHQHAYPVLR